MSHAATSSPLLSHQGPLHIGSVTLNARDMTALAAYYERAIGLQRIATSNDRITLGSGGVGYLHLLATPDAKPEPQGCAGLFHTAFLLPSRGDLGVWFKAAHGAQVRFDGASDHGVSDAFYLTDPEGNGIEVYADRPVSAWARPAGGRPFEVAMTTLPMDIAAVIKAGEAHAGQPQTNGRFPDEARIGHVHRGATARRSSRQAAITTTSQPTPGAARAPVSVRRASRVWRRWNSP
jgi:catechol 2,3-dioxygenase